MRSIVDQATVQLVVSRGAVAGLVHIVGGGVVWDMGEGLR